MTKIYEQLQAIAERHPALLVSNKTDLTVHDRRSTRGMVAGQRWIWILYRLGTQLFPVGEGQDPVFVEHWIREDPRCLTFLIRVGADGADICSIPHEAALALAREPAPKGVVCWQPLLCGSRLLKDGVEIARLEAVNASYWLMDGDTVVDRFRSRGEAVIMAERIYGPRRPVVV